jgi:hypothetical protein
MFRIASSTPTGGPPGRPNDYTTYYSVVPYRTTITTTLGGFGYPNPVTSYSYGMSTTTVTIVNPAGAPQNPQYQGPGQPFPYGQNQPPQSTPHRTTTVTIGWPNNNLPLPPQGGPPSSRPTTTITVTAGGQPQYNPSRPPQPPPIPPKSSTPKYTPPQYQEPTNTGPPWSRPSDEPATPPAGQGTPAPGSSSTRPPPWHPPSGVGGSWTPVADPTVPSGPATPQQPPATPSAPKTTSSALPPNLGPPPALPGALIPCGPGMDKCKADFYCDPQPLCSIGEDCPGVCLPVMAEIPERYTNVSTKEDFLLGSELNFIIVNNIMGDTARDMAKSAR